MIDLHCHLLPGIDDGPETMDGTLDLARAHVAAGVTVVAATPHIDWDWQNRAATVRTGVTEVRAALSAAGIPLEVVTGGEIAMTLAPDLGDDELTALRLGGGPRILVECPLSPGMIGLDRVVAHLQDRGHEILLAHPERSPAFQRDPDLLTRIVAGGALAQVTAGAFTGQFGTIVQRTALDMAGRGLVHVVASDAHDVLRRPPGLREPLEAAGLGAMVPWWCAAVPRAVLDGTVPPAAPALPAVPPGAKPRRLFRRRSPFRPT